ncbi:efflux RND transporter permease subunit [Marinimicrobium locisalis]|uniref:efflux RND transporter permease subunit n=1 Tax=Marinimicrobium locisalis TaxID=546022 RepID=UPI003221AFFE
MRSFKSDVISRFVVHHPVKSILLALLLSLTAIAGVRNLEADFTYRAFFSEGNPLREEVEAFERQFSNDDTAVLMVRSPSGIFDPESARLVVELTEAMWALPEVVRVDSVSNYRWVHAANDEIVVEPLIPEQGQLSQKMLDQRREVALNHEIIPDYLLSQDGTTTMIVATVRNAQDTAVDPEPVISGVRDLIEQHQSGDHEFHITGRLAIMQGMKESSQADVQARLPLILAAILFIIFVRFRSLGAMLSVLPLLFLSVAATMGLAGWLGIKISNITALVPQFIIAICVADSIHIITRCFELRRQGKERRAAAQLALQENFTPTVLTTLTTTAAFFSFTTSDIRAISDLGILVGIGTIIAWLVTYFVVGAILSWLPQKKTNSAAAAAEPLEGPGAEGTAPVQSSELPRWVMRYTEWLRDKALAITVGFVILIGASVFIASLNQINANPFQYFASGFWLREANDFAQEHLKGAQGIEVVVETGEPDGIKRPEFLKQTEAFQQWIDRDIPNVVRTYSIVDIVKQSNRSLHNDDPAEYRIPDSPQAISELMFLYSLNLPQGLDLSDRVSLKNDSLRITVKWTNYNSSQATRLAKEIEQKGQAMGLDVHTTGKMLLFQRMNGYVASSFLVTLGLTILVVSLILMATFRSVQLGLISLATNIFPLCLGMAVLQLSGHSIDIGAVVVLSVCLGVAIDDTIHFINHTRMRQNQGWPMLDIVRDTFSHVVPAISLTSVILVLAFGSFITASFVPNANFGLMAIAILSTAWLANVSLLPAIMYLLENRKEKRVSAVGPKVLHPEQ